MLSTTYDNLLVVASLLVAVLASYTALDMAERVNTTIGHSSNATRLWLTGGAIAMGVGIWSMHFIGMLALHLPISIGYDVRITALSLAIAIATSGFALWIVARQKLPIMYLLCSAMLMGSGIASMHYTGMAAMRMQPSIQYNPLLLLASIFIAIAASTAALLIAFRLRTNTPGMKVSRIFASAMMGMAIGGMHYTGMAAANFSDNSICMAVQEGIDSRWLAVFIIIVTLAILTIALLTSVLDSRLESRTAKLVRSLTEANEELKQMVLHDPLTKLPNRTLLDERLNQAKNKTALNKCQLALIFLDLDGFKDINDSLGHHIGDRLLIDIAQRLSSTMNTDDTVTRLGGDEFVILTEIVTSEDAIPVVEKLLSALKRPFFFEHHELRVSASAGVAIYPQDGSTIHDLLINADAAMYHAKRSGRDGYSFFEPSMNIAVHDQLYWLQDLRMAMERKQLRLLYQPKVSLPDGLIIGAEALLRWQHPVRGTVSPDDFISLAERSGLIIPIGTWVINEACRQMSEWSKLGYTDWKIAVNLSPLQFADSQLVGTVTTALERHQLPPHYLSLEVTESTAMYDIDTSLRTLQKIADLGVDISIDDFGTGYSSLLYLKRIPARELKIDRAFVHNISESKEDAAIVSAIVGLSQMLGFRSVAEGVETETQRQFLASIGCNALQGYLIAKPMTPEEFLSFNNS